MRVNGCQSLSDVINCRGVARVTMGRWGLHGWVVTQRRWSRQRWTADECMGNGG